MKTGLTLTELAAELERQRKERRDFVADTRKMSMHSAVAPDGEPVSVLQIDGVDKGTFGVTDHAHRQIGSRLKVPAKFYDRLRRDHPALLDWNVNSLMQAEPEKRMVRTLDGHARAFLSDRYFPIDNDQVAGALLPVLHKVGKSAGLEIASCNVTHDRLTIKATFPKIRGEVGVGDVVEAGVLVTNSEIGTGSYAVRTLVHRLVCSNGMVLPDRSFRRNHVGRQLGGDGMGMEIYRRETIAADTKAMMLKLQDVVAAAANSAKFAESVDRMRDAAGRKIERAVGEIVEVVQDRYALSDAESAGVLNHLAQGGDLSQWGLLNAVTRQAQDVDDYDRSTQLEHVGGMILDLSSRDWRSLAVAA